MPDRDSIKATVLDLYAATRKAEDAKDPTVAAAIQVLSEAYTTWLAEDAKITKAEPVLQAANGLLDALHEINTEGLPFGIRDQGTEMQTILDQAAEEGFDVSAPRSPTP